MNLIEGMAKESWNKAKEGFVDLKSFQKLGGS